MLAVSNQNPLPFFEKWTPDLEMGEGSLDNCLICYDPLNENPDPNNKDLVPEVFGHRQNNTIFHKVHFYCLNQWIAQRPFSLSVNNTVLCPGGCDMLINCDVVHPPGKPLAEFKTRLAEAHLLGCVTATISQLFMLSMIDTAAKVFYEQPLVCTLIVGSVIALSSYYYRKTELPKIIEQHMHQTAMKTDLLADSIARGFVSGLSVGMVLLFYTMVSVVYCMSTAKDQWPKCWDPPMRRV